MLRLKDIGETGGDDSALVPAGLERFERQNARSADSGRHQLC